LNRQESVLIDGARGEQRPPTRVSALLNRRMIVCGGASGMGASTVRALVGAGAHVAILDIQQAAGSALADALGEQASPRQKVRFFAADVSDPVAVRAAVDAAADALEGVDGLFHHAGVLAVRPYHEMSDAEWGRLMRVNVDGAFYVTRDVIPHMIRAGGGDMVITASISSGRAFPLESGYCISKAAVLHMARCIAVEYRDAGIRCNAICPAFTRTPHGTSEIEQLVALGQDWDESGLAEKQGRICEPEEVAEAVLFLLDRDKSSFINGQDIYIDNGWSASG
jgi:NAD(P)-dependent dehydrogenase (short-subunit alcohol dehydrogenase family)